jgi:hypothetical protein
LSYDHQLHDLLIQRVGLAHRIGRVKYGFTNLLFPLPPNLLQRFIVGLEQIVHHLILSVTCVTPILDSLAFLRWSHKDYEGVLCSAQKWFRIMEIHASEFWGADIDLPWVPVPGSASEDL